MSFSLLLDWRIWSMLSLLYIKGPNIFTLVRPEWSAGASLRYTCFPRSQYSFIVPLIGKRKFCSNWIKLKNIYKWFIYDSCSISRGIFNPFSTCQNWKPYKQPFFSCKFWKLFWIMSLLLYMSNIVVASADLGLERFIYKRQLSRLSLEQKSHPFNLVNELSWCLIIYIFAKQYSWSFTLTL